MTNDPLMAAWNNLQAAPRSGEELHAMRLERRHPVLKQIRRQLLVEAIALAALLTVYNDIFDGGRRPAYAHAALVAAALLLIVHNLAGYFLSRHHPGGNNLREMLTRQVSRWKRYAVFSVGIRALWALGLALFFGSLSGWQGYRVWIWVGIALIFLVQMVWLSWIWAGRIRELRRAADGFMPEEA